MKHLHLTAPHFAQLHPSRLHVALVTETFAPEVNGVAMTLGQLVRGLRSMNHTVQVVRPRQTHDSPNNRAHGGVTRHTTNDCRCANDVQEALTRGIPLPNYGSLQFGLPSANLLYRLWREQRPDIVHVATEGPLGWSAVNVAKKLGLPVTSSFHTNFHSYSNHYQLGWLEALIDRLLRTMHNKTAATLVPTRAMQLELARRGYNDLNIMSRGVDLALFNPQRRSESLRRHWGMGSNDLVVCYVGRLAREKNMDLLIQAFNAVCVSKPSAKLLLVGDGPSRGDLQKALPQAVFAGTRRAEDLASHYASSDLFLFPSLTDTFGNVVPEALASGLPVIAFDRAAAAELVVNEVNGCKVREGSDYDFVRAASTLVNQPDLLRRLGRQAPASVKHLGWSTVVESLVQTFRGVIAAHPSTAMETARWVPELD